MKVENVQKDITFTITLSLGELQHITASVGGVSQAQAYVQGIDVDTGKLYSQLDALLTNNGFGTPSYE